MNFNTTLITVVLLLFTAGNSEAGAINTDEPVTGEVVNAATGEPIAGATLLIRELDRGAAADADGKFAFRNLTAGNYTLIVRAIGFIEQTVQVAMPANEELIIRLQPEIIRADDIVITASPLGRNIRYQPAQAMNLEELQQKAAPGLGEILDGSPGVSSRSFGSAPSRPVIRGMDGDRVLVLQNGERMGDLSGTAVDHAVSLDPLSMDRVEVIRGPASLLYGSSAIGGVVNLFSNDMPREWETGTSGSLATHVATVNDMGAGLARYQYGGDQFAATGRIIYRDGGDLRTPEGRLPDTAINNLSYGAGVAYRSGRFETGLSFSGMDYTYGLPEEIDDPNEKVEIRMNRMNLQSVSTLQMDRFFELVEFRIQYSDYQHDEFEMEFEPDGTVDEDLEISFDQQTISSSLLLRHRPAGPFEGAIGLSFNYSQLDVGGDEALTPNAESYFIAGYIYEEIRLNRFLSMKTGARVEFKEMFVKTNELFPDADQFEDRSDLILSGAVGLNFNPNRNWESGLQLARAFRTPGVEELYSNAPHLAAGSFDVGDPTLGNEISLGTDFFIRYSNRSIRTELSLFANRINNFVNFSPTGETHQPSGLPIFEYGATDALLYGFEFQTDIAFSEQLRAGIGFDYVRGQERAGEQNDLPFIPPFRTHLSMMYDTGTWWAGPRLRIANSQERVAPNEDPTDGYLLVGMDAGYRFGHGVSFALRVDNLLNESYRDHLSRVEDRNNPMPARNINAMLRWDF